MDLEETSQAQPLVKPASGGDAKRRDWYEKTDLFLKAALPVSLFFLSCAVTESQRRQDLARSDREASSRAAAVAIERELNQAQIRANRATQLMSALASPRSLEREIALSVALALKEERLLSPELVAAIQEVFRRERRLPDSRVAELAAKVLDSSYQAAVPRILGGSGDYRVSGDGPGWVLVGILSRSTGTWTFQLPTDMAALRPGAYVELGESVVMYSVKGGVQDGQFMYPDGATHRIRGLAREEGVRVEGLDTLTNGGDSLLVWAEVLPQFTRRW